MFGSIRSFGAKIVLGAALLLALSAITLLATGSPRTARAATIVQDNDLSVTLGNWYGTTYSGYSGGAARYADTVGSTAQFTFSGTAVTWVTYKGSYGGKAQILIDGTSKGTFDLYATSAQYQYKITFSGLANKTHTMKIEVVTPNPAATFGEVFIDAFIVGNTTSQETSLKISYDGWRDVSNTSASGGSFHSSSLKTAYIYFYNFNASVSYSWVTATGPGYGKAAVIIDGIQQAVVDLYSPTQHWQVVKTFSMPAGPGTHTISIHPLGQKNPASTGTKVVVDGFSYQ